MNLWILKPDIFEGSFKSSELSNSFDNEVTLQGDFEKRWWWTHTWKSWNEMSTRDNSGPDIY